MADETTSNVASPVPPVEPRSAQPTSNTPPVANSPKQPHDPAPNPTTGQQGIMDAEARIQRLLKQNDLTVRQRDQQIASLNQQIQQMRTQMVNVQAQGMDEQDAEIFRRDQYIRDLQEQNQQMQMAAARAQQEMGVNNELLVMADETGVPFADLKDLWMQGQQAHDIWRYAVRQTKERLTTAQKRDIEKAAQQLEAAQDKAEEEAAIEKEKPVDLGTGASASAIPPHVRATRNKDAPSFVLAYLDNLEKQQRAAR